MINIKLIEQAITENEKRESVPFKMQASGKSLKKSFGNYVELSHLTDDETYTFTCLNDLLKRGHLE